MIELKVDRDKAIRLMREMAELWNDLPWTTTYKPDSEEGLDDETCKWVELYELHDNMGKIEEIFHKLYGEDYQYRLNEMKK